MGRINGFGTTLLGIEREGDLPGDPTVAHKWFTAFFLPLFPYGAERVVFLPHDGAGVSYVTLESVSVDPRSIIKTYLFSWVLMPVLLFAPLFLLVTRQTMSRDSTQAIYGAWVLLIVFGLWTWHERRTNPLRACRALIKGVLAGKVTRESDPELLEPNNLPFAVEWMGREQRDWFGKRLKKATSDDGRALIAQLLTQINDRQKYMTG